MYHWYPKFNIVLMLVTVYNRNVTEMGIVTVYSSFYTLTSLDNESAENI